MCLMRPVTVFLTELSPVTNQGAFPLSKLSLKPPAWPRTGAARAHDAAEDAPEAAEDCSLHRAGQLPALAGADTPEDQTVHLRADPPLPQRKPLHHRRLPGTPALQALPEKVRNTNL